MESVPEPGADPDPPPIIDLSQAAADFIPVEEVTRGLPDNITADTFEMEEDGLISATGNVRITINSVIIGGTLEVEADHVDYDLESGAAELSGTVRVALAGTQLAFVCDYLDYDPTLEFLTVRGLRLNVPLSEILDEKDMDSGPPEPSFDGHFFGQIPRNVMLVVDEAELGLSEERRSFLLRRVRISPGTRPDPDLYLKAKEVVLEEQERIVFHDISLYLSGIKVFAWPRISRGLVKEERPIDFAFPVIRIDRDIGIAWKQGIDLRYEQLRAEASLDYSAEYGLLSHSYVFIEPVEGARIGVQAGSRTAVDADRRIVERRETYNFVYEQNFGEVEELYRDLDLRFEYGELASTPRFQDPAGQPPVSTEATRLYLEGDIDFPLVELGDDLYFASGGLYRHIDYRDPNQKYVVYGGRAALILRSQGFDHFIELRSNNISGNPVLHFDELRQREVIFATSVRLHPEWRHVVRGNFDLTRDKFDLLEVGAMKKQKNYEIGVYWDFSRHNAGFEFGLLMD